MNLNITNATKKAAAFMFIGASGYGIGNAISGYLYPEFHTLQDLLSQLTILIGIFIFSVYCLNKINPLAPETITETE